MVHPARPLPVLLTLLLALGLVLTTAPPAQAQSPTPSMTVTNGNDDVRLQSFYDGGLLIPGIFRPSAPNDSIPATGAGTRLMWYPAKAAFRAGRVDGSQWDAANVGRYSVALGLGTTASERSAVAIGNDATAEGLEATSIGFETKASGNQSTALGLFTNATTKRSLSLGVCNNANTSDDGTLFVVGNGDSGASSCNSRSDALVLDDGGNLEVSGSFILPDGTTLDESSDLKSGLPTNSNGASLVSNDDGLVAPGTFGSGSIPTTGAGTRVMWYPNKAAFRAGRVGLDQSDTWWDASNVGNYSMALGTDTKASGEASVALGNETEATALHATAMGDQTDATASNATAMGDFTDAAADEAVSMGFATTASTTQSLSIGECNSANTSGDGTLFVAGNGTFSLGTCTRSDAMVLDKDAGLLVNGELGTGSIPTSGSGTRMMWYPGKAAFRAGQVGGSQWDNSNVGKHSTAFGEDVTASGRKSFAAGFDASATNVEAVALGKNVNATGTQAVAIGQGADASGSSAVALGSNTNAGGFASTALGRHTQAETDQSLSVGRYNDANTSADNTLFVVGNGGSSGNRSDALTLDESGNFSIDGVVEPNESGEPAMHFQRSFAGDDDVPGNYVALVENTVGDFGDGLAIQAGETDRISQDVNMITFFDADGDPAGNIQGDGLSGTPGVEFNGTGSDYAEELPVAEGSSKPEATDLVGVRSGEASLDTDGADRVMIVSTSPIMIGNADLSTESNDKDRVEVAFIGQVPTRVRGSVETGDLIVASGKNDGTARAIAPSEYRSATHGPIAGQAWADKSSEGIGTVNVAVGIGRSGAVAERLQAQQAQIDSLRRRTERLAEVEKQIAALRATVQDDARAAGWTHGLPLRSLALLLVGGLLGAGLLRLHRQ